MLRGKRQSFPSQNTQVKTADGSNVETKLASLQTAVTGKVPCYVVNDIAARDGLESPKQGDLGWVKDATADATVSTGAARASIGDLKMPGQPTRQPSRPMDRSS